MEKRNIEIHKFHIHPQGNKDVKVSLNNIDGIDFYSLLKKDYVNFVDTLPKDKFSKRIIKFHKEKIDDKIKTKYRLRDELRIISGKIVTGKYGKIENVIDVDKKMENQYLQFWEIMLFKSHFSS
ncbi:MAG: hypothetical protein JXR82_15525 [Marinifilaceae bacterium]|nr:hypothetical protein [Marinifilaceae bacterium]